MLPPVLEIYVVWHPEDKAGAAAAANVFEHFHGTVFSGLIGGAIEVYARSAGWRSNVDAPRPIPVPGAVMPNGLSTARLIALVPVLGVELAAAVEDCTNPWNGFTQAMVDAQQRAPDRVGIFPLATDAQATDGTKLGRLFGRFQRIAAPSPFVDPEPTEELLCRDLAQGIAQLAAGSDARLNVFISHTKRTGAGEEEHLPALIALVRTIIGETRLQHFFDATDLQPGRDWDAALRAEAARSALLALRTDLYASRAWCQREMLIAKRHGMPIVILDSLGVGEERGSFLMDHLPRIPVREDGGSWSKADIRRGLNLLVDECLKRALWNVQKALAADRPELGVAWWAPHAPEPITFAQWLEECAAEGMFPLGDADLRILHPDPPLGADEKAPLEQIASLMGHRGRFDVMTPRLLAARGA
jgi:hypothetical protein